MNVFKTMTLLAMVFIPNLVYAGPCGFRVHKNGKTQYGGFINGDYARTGNTSTLDWAATSSPNSFDVGGRFAGGKWTPVAPGEPERLVTLSGQIWISYGGININGGVPNFVVKIIKNGYGCTNGPCAQSVFAGIGTPGSWPQSFVIPFAGTDLAKPGDYYQVFLYTTNPAAWVDGNPAHTWFSGVCN